MIEVGGLAHVSIPVRDLNRARAFYGDVLCLTELERPAFRFEGAWYQVGDQQLHLIVHPGSRTDRGTTDITRLWSTFRGTASRAVSVSGTARRGPRSS